MTLTIDITGPRSDYYCYGLWNAGEQRWYNNAWADADEAYRNLDLMPDSNRWKVRKLVSAPVYEDVPRPPFRFKVGQVVTEDMPIPPNGTVILADGYSAVQIDDGHVDDDMSLVLDNSWESNLDYMVRVSTQEFKIVRVGWEN